MVYLTLTSGLQGRHVHNYVSIVSKTGTALPRTEIQDYAWSPQLFTDVEYMVEIETFGILIQVRIKEA